MIKQKELEAVNKIVNLIGAEETMPRVKSKAKKTKKKKKGTKPRPNVEHLMEPPSVLHK